MRTSCQRWLERRSTEAPRALIDPSRYGVEVVLERDARPFVERHHYSATYPAARLAVGLYEARRWVVPELVGVAVFSVCVQDRAITRWLGVEPRAGVELGRFVLLDGVPANGETWFLARALKKLGEQLPDVAGVLSYSDPLRRVTTEGEVICPGHVGLIYQASNAAYLGTSNPRWLWLDRDGRTVSERLLSKIRGGEVGWESGARRIVALGAPPRQFGEEGAAWLARVAASGCFRRVRHPGNHAYALGKIAKSKASSPYPKQNKEVEP